jgi:thymidylate synthase (FAD)
MVLKINARALFHMAELRLCTRAFWEFRELMEDIYQALLYLDDEFPDANGWDWIAEQLKPKCEKVGYCTEKFCCGMYPKKEDVIK